MKIAVLNFSGNVGKTTIAKNLLLPRLSNTPIVAIETINDDGEISTKIKGKDFASLQDELLISDNLIVDIGASNIEETMKLMAQYKGSHEDFDYFVIPVVPDVKQQIDTATTISSLVELGVKSNKIRLVLNMVDEQENIENDFSRIFEIIRAAKIKEPKIGISASELYPRLRQLETTIDDILALTDLREKLKSAKDETEKRQYASLIGVQRLAQTAKENLDKVFNDLSLK